MLRATVQRMREERYPISLLWGISDFYHRFGYVPVLPGYSLTVTTRNLERLISATGGGPTGAAVRVGTDADAPALTELYHRASARRTGTLRREPRRFDLTPPRQTDNWWRHTRRVLIAEVGAKPVGYALLHGDPAQLRILESIVEEDAETAGLALLAALAREALERREGEIKLPLPPDEPLAQVLRRAGCKVEVTYPANGGGMGRIVDLPALAEAIQPALVKRAEELPTGDPPAALGLVCIAGDGESEQRATLRLSTQERSAGRTAHLRLPQQRLCQLLMGYRGIDAIRREHPDACAAEDVALIRALFPEGYPHMWSIDHF
jgi:predicted acetyltransferase